MDSQQELFTKLLVNLRKIEDTLGAKTYDGRLPPKGTKYPFVYLADSQTINSQMKNAIIRGVTQTIHVYSNDIYRRGSFSEIIEKIIAVCYEMENNNGRKFAVDNLDYRILPDNTTEEPLLHGVISIKFRTY